ncbi:DUF2786 domain-containing protein [Corynebacterium sp. NPDC060344]|uniref:DUF2786 domain-containing protein n=1 Tax=Corynebacterium sp. NPDC060344 TaxID=3347101 RepID=UPI0036619A9B
MRGDIREKVRKLLNQATDREGTPEGDVFRDKAFALIAQYGLDPAKLGDPSDAGAAMKVVELDMSGAYQRQQIGLLNALARALHCEVVLWSGGGATGGRGMGRGADRGTLIGAARHVERVQLLFSMLCPHMLAGAARLRAGDSARTARWRRSYMVGFATVVGDRLAELERGAAQRADLDAQRRPAGGSASLVLKDDAQRARDEMRRRYPFLRHTSSKARLDGDAFRHGCDAGFNSDLGQARMGARRALGG